jgi:DNA-directed RNA polymerase subunit E'
MYKKVRRTDVIRLTPERLGDDYETICRNLTRETLEGKASPDKSLTILVSNIENVGEGRIVHGDGAIYQKVAYDAIVFKPQLHEIVNGQIVEILKFGAFVRFGPLDGLLHVSQIMDDRIDVDSAGQRLVGKDTKKDLRVGDTVKARIVAVSMNERNPRESKIGLTMRQNALGKVEWIDDSRKKPEEKGKKPRPKKKKGAKKAPAAKKK